MTPIYPLFTEAQVIEILTTLFATQIITTFSEINALRDEDRKPGLRANSA